MCSWSPEWPQVLEERPLGRTTQGSRCHRWTDSWPPEMYNWMMRKQGRSTGSLSSHLCSASCWLNPTGTKRWLAQGRAALDESRAEKGRNASWSVDMAGLESKQHPGLLVSSWVMYLCFFQDTVTSRHLAPDCDTSFFLHWLLWLLLFELNDLAGKCRVLPMF